MIKYLVGYEDGVEVVVNTRADAEEYILSLAEEAVYEDYIAEVYYYDRDLKSYSEEWAEKMADVNDYRKQYPSWQNPFSTLYGFILNYHGEYYYISEVGVLE